MRDPFAGERLAAAVDLTRAEREVYRGALTAIGEFLALARQGMLGEPEVAVTACGLPDGGYPFLRAALRAVAVAAVRDTAATRQAVTAAAEVPPDEGGWPTAQQWAELLERYVLAPLALLFGDAFARAALDAPVAAAAYVEQYLAEVFDRLVIWPAGAFEEIRVELQVSREAGESVDQLRDRIGAVLGIDAVSRRLRARAAELRAIRDDPDADPAARADARRQLTALYRDLNDEDRLWQWKARRIARTETQGAVNGGTYAGALAYAEATGISRYKQWLATPDARTRHSHAVADGQVVALTDVFHVGHARLLHPGQAGGPAHEVINCRCTIRVLDAGAAADAHELANRFKAATGDEAFPTPTGLDALTAAAQEVTMADTDVIDAPADEQQEQEQEARLPDGWRGPLFPLGHLSGDGRMFADVANVRVRPLPLPISFQERSAPGHDNAFVFGRIDRVWVEEIGGVRFAMGEGAIDLDSPEAAEVARKLRDGFAGWVSVDADDCTVEMACVGSDGELGDCESLGVVDDDGWILEIPEDVKVVQHFTDYRVMGATLVASPAFDNVRVEPVYDYAGLGGAAVASAGAGAVQELPALVAGGGPLAPPVDWFDNPGLTGPTGVVVMDSGRIFGHLAGWDTDHIGAAGQRLRPPTSPSGYRYFHVGTVVCAGGEELAVGTLVLGTDHPSLRFDAARAMAHYADTGRGVAVVRVGEDAHGIWVAGAVLPGVSDEDLATMRRCPLSGDWREVAGRLELVAALHVNVPGFPLPRQKTGEGAAVCALTAAGVMQPVRLRRGAGSFTVEQVREIATAAAAEALRALDARRSRAERLAAVRGRMARVRVERAGELLRRR